MNNLRKSMCSQDFGLTKFLRMVWNEEIWIIEYFLETHEPVNFANIIWDHHIGALRRDGE